MARKAKRTTRRKRRDRPPLSKHGELTMDDVDWFAKNKYLPKPVIDLLAERVNAREEASTGE